jgi:hypothetical protein
MTRAAALSKKAATLEAMQAEAAASAPTVCTDASGVRIRTVAVHLTPFAPGCRSLPLNDRKRWATLWGVTPVRAVKATCKRLNQSPRNLTVDTAAQAAGDVALMGAVPPELLELVSARRSERVPFAIYWDGLTAAEIQEALAALVAAGWEPPVALPDNI